MPSGTLLQCNSGETFPPTQFGLVAMMAWLLATFFGIILPSAKVFDCSVNSPAALAAVPAKPNASAAAPAATR